MKLPGLSFSLKRALGITAAKQKIAKKTGVERMPMGYAQNCYGKDYGRHAEQALWSR